MGSGSAMKAELWGAFYGLSLAWDLGLWKIILEVDNKNVVKQLVEMKSHPGRNWNLVAPLEALLRRQWSVQVRHIYRECNRSADALANLGHSNVLSDRIAA
ncbi:hypothetical protein Scep_016223 [Stephania cephalantha]|uniref:RNase H type-1 domain-containing protein n=1 Tax=Stephania cephalantha TaxID=152367 RepID=A0AAP0IMS0_9MAGN